MKTRIALALLALTMLAGCKGDPGDPGAPGTSGRIVSTMNCTGEITGAHPDLNGLDVEYDAVLLANGDVYATGTIIDEVWQYSGTAFFAAGQSGASTAAVMVTADYVGVANQGYFRISLNRSTMVTSVVYTDPSLGAPINMTFSASACTEQNW